MKTGLLPKTVAMRSEDWADRVVRVIRMAIFLFGTWMLYRATHNAIGAMAIAVMILTGVKLGSNQ